MNLEDPQLLSDEITCSKCGTAQSEGYKFCNICGAQNLKRVRKKFAAEQKEERAYQQIWTYILVTFGLLAISYFLDDSFEILVGTSIIFAVVDIIFATRQPSIWGLFRVKNIDPDLLFLVFIACIGSGVVVHFGITALNDILFEETFTYQRYFIGKSNAIWLAILFIAVFPAIFEELAFRGFVYSNLNIVVNSDAALWGSTFLFAIVHFSLLSLIWLIPFAYGLGLLRRKYDTLVYGMVGHFTHNCTVLLMEFYVN